MYYVYILKSEKNNKYYVGYADNVARRIEEHNNARVKSTKAHKPWTIFHVEEFSSQKEAILRERQIKSWKKRRMIEKLKFTRPRLGLGRDEVGK